MASKTSFHSLYGIATLGWFWGVNAGFICLYMEYWGKDWWPFDLHLEEEGHIETGCPHSASVASVASVFVDSI